MQKVEIWSVDQSGFSEAIQAAETSDVAAVVVGTWSRDQIELWQGLNTVRECAERPVFSNAFLIKDRWRACRRGRFGTCRCTTATSQSYQSHR